MNKPVIPIALCSIFPLILSCSPVTQNTSSSPQDQVKLIEQLDGTTQSVDLSINPVTVWNGQASTSKAVYDTILGGGGVPAKGAITSVSENNGMISLSCSVAQQSSEMEIGNDYSGAASMTLKINPSRNSFVVTYPSGSGQLWKVGKKVTFRVGKSGAIIQMDDGAYTGYTVSGSGAQLSLKYGGKSVSGVGDLRGGIGADYVVLRNGKWYVFGYEKGPGGSSVSWVIKKVKPQGN